MQPQKIDKLTLSCVALLWCKDDDYQNSNKHSFFKQLSRENSIKYLIEKMVRISTILVYGRLKDFNINSNQFFYDQEFEILNEKIRDLVDMIYLKMQIDEEEMDQSEVEKKIRLPIYIYDSSELRKKLNMLAFQPDKVQF